MKFSRYIARQLPLPNGDGGIRTLDPLLARQVLSQLSYTPISGLPLDFQFSPMGLSGPYLYECKASLNL